MVKIKEEPKEREVRCEKCDRLLTYSKEDIEQEQSGMNEFYDVIKCPACGSEVRV